MLLHRLEPGRFASVVVSVNHFAIIPAGLHVKKVYLKYIIRKKF